MLPGPSAFVDLLVAGKVWCYLPQVSDGLGRRCGDLSTELPVDQGI